MKRNAIIAVVVLLFGGLLAYKYYETNHAPKKEIAATHSTDVATSPVSESTPTSSSSTAAPTKHVDIEVARPIEGTKKGVVEVGASGFNAFVVTIDKSKNWELDWKSFGASLAYEGFATTQDVKDQLKKYLIEITNRGVAGKNAHFVISSGALKNPKTELIAQAIKDMGYVVNKVTADQEGKHALRALLPKAYTSNSFVVDIGSGNTKVSWYEGAALKTVEAPGAKYYQVDGMNDEKAAAEIKQAIAKVPQDKRANCFMIGGVPFQLAKETREGEERFTTLQSPDYYSAGDDVKKKSGLNIYQAIVDESGTPNFVFDWDANFTIGFLMTLN